MGKKNFKKTDWETLKREEERRRHLYDWDIVFNFTIEGETTRVVKMDREQFAEYMYDGEKEKFEDAHGDLERYFYTVQSTEGRGSTSIGIKTYTNKYYILREVVPAVDVAITTEKGLIIRLLKEAGINLYI